MQQSQDIIEINRTISDIIEDYFLVCDNKGQIVFSNKAMQRYIGYEEMTLKNMSFFDIINGTQYNNTQLFLRILPVKLSNPEVFYLIEDREWANWI